MKASIITPQSLHKSSEEKSLKHEGKMSDKHSPEYRLGIGIEKLLEQGVRVEKIDDVVNNSNGKIDKVPIKKGFARATNKNVCLVKGKSKRRRRRFIMINGKRERVAKLTKNQAENKDSIVTNFKSGTVKNAVEACLNSMVQFQSKNQLLDEGLPLNLQISSIRKAVMPKRFVRFQLPHSYLDDLADICLIVPDEKSWNNKLKDPELTINETQDFLRTNDVSCVKKILTLHQLKTEYMVHEMRRKLCNSYDYFLADHRLADEIHTHLGKEFQKQRKGPVSIKMHRGNLKARVNKALAKSVMKLSSDQDTFSCRIGHSKQDIDELVDNIVAVGQQLDTFFPGNFKNVRSVSLKSSRSIGFPVYYSTKPVNEVPRPIVAPKRPKMYEVATDELSTIGKQVQVHPDGTVTVVDDQTQSKKSKNNLNVNKATKSPAKKNVPVKKEEEDEEEEEEEEEDEPNSDEEFEIDSDDDFDDNVEEEVDSDSNSPFTFEKKKKNSKTVTKVDGSDESGTDESDTEDEDFSRKTEEAYLQSLGGDSDSEEEDDDVEEVEKEEEKQEVKQKEVKDQKKRKTPEIKDAKNVSPKKFKPSAPAEQPALSKAKGNINSTIPKQANPPSNKQKAKAVKRKTFDTSLGETWSIKKKCDAPAGEKVAPKKKNRSKSKLNKSQKKGNMKMKKAKQNKD